MYRYIPKLIVIFILIAALGCENRIWENQYDPQSPTYPGQEYFVFDSYQCHEGIYYIIFRLKFANALVSRCEFEHNWYFNGQKLATYRDAVPPGYIGVYLGVWSPYEFETGNYKVVVNYGGEFYAEASCHIVGSYQEKPIEVDPGFYHFKPLNLDK